MLSFLPLGFQVGEAVFSGNRAESTQIGLSQVALSVCLPDNPHVSLCVCRKWRKPLADSLLTNIECMQERFDIF